MININHISKSFKTQVVLKDINLSITENEIFGIIGPSGTGKTTLIRLIIGAISPDSGNVQLMNISMPNLNALPHIGYMPQNHALYTDLSGYDNLVFFGGMYGLDSKELKHQINRVLDLVELHDEKDKKVLNYSGGMKKRLSLAVSLVHNPKILVLDEPTVGIDPLLRNKIWNEFQNLKKEGKTIIVTTHVMDEAIKCDRLCLLHNGKVIDCNSVELLLNKTKTRNIEELYFSKEQ